MVGGTELQLLKEYPRHVVVVVLPGVHEDFFDICAFQCLTQQACFYELRPSTDDRDDSHAGIGLLVTSIKRSMTCCWSVAPSSGKIGSESTSFAACSARGKAPTFKPRFL